MTCQSSESRRANDSAAVESDESRLALNMKDLKNTGWYWGPITASEARTILQDTSEGTFLLRDSSQRNFLFTLSAMTSAGPTNIRIEYKRGKFTLDSVVMVKPKLKQFDTVVRLVEHYFDLSKTSDDDGATSSQSSMAAGPSRLMQLLLTKPVYTTTPSLQHLCRITINRRTRQIQDLPLPNRMKNYLKEYAYNV